MKKNIVIGNWKMNTLFEEAKALIENLNKQNTEHLETIVLVPNIYLTELQKIANVNLSIGAQNVSSFKNGAYTGEISAAMLKSINVRYVAIGHSERRTLFQENDATILAKVKQALANGLCPILCCGEPLESRKQGTYLNFISNQINYIISEISAEDMKNIIIAYEPIWAIGTGETASAAQAQEVHTHIRHNIAEQFGEQIANNTTILYGGSVKPTNAKTLFAEKDINGALVGGASLKADSFLDIVKAN